MDMTSTRTWPFRAHLAAILATVIMLLGTLSGLFTADVHAAGGIDWGTAVRITQSNQVVDSMTLNGKYVESIYAPRGSISDYDSNATYCCAAFVKKFYKTVYGVDVWNLYPGNQPSVSSGCFTKTSSPQPGDIAGNSGHWAIVKSVSGGAVKVIEQNCWNTKYDSAMVGRTLYSDSGYWYWRWSGASTQGSSSQDTSSQGSASKPKVSFTAEFWTPQVSRTNATVKTTFYNPGKIHVKEVGINLYDANGNLIKKFNESCSRPESKFYVWYDITAELGIKLKSNTKYQYEFFIVHDGVNYVTSRQSFKTT